MPSLPTNWALSADDVSLVEVINDNITARIINMTERVVRARVYLEVFFLNHDVAGFEICFCMKT